MKLANRILCGLFLTFACLSAGSVNTRVSGHPSLPANDKSQADHGGKIDSKYDGFSRETVVTLNKMRVTCGGTVNFKDACVSLMAALHCPGVQLDFVRYVRVQLIFQTKDWDQRHPLNRRQLSVVADGETFRLGQMKLVDQSVDTLMTEVLEANISYSVFKKIALAQVAAMKVGNSEFELREQNLAALRDLNNRVKY